MPINLHRLVFPLALIFSSTSAHGNEWWLDVGSGAYLAAGKKMLSLNLSLSYLHQSTLLSWERSKHFDITKKLDSGYDCFFSALKCEKETGEFFVNSLLVGKHYSNGKKTSAVSTGFCKIKANDFDNANKNYSESCIPVKLFWAYRLNPKLVGQFQFTANYNKKRSYLSSILSLKYKLY